MAIVEAFLAVCVAALLVGEGALGAAAKRGFSKRSLAPCLSCGQLNAISCIHAHPLYPCLAPRTPQSNPEGPFVHGSEPAVTDFELMPKLHHLDIVTRHFKVRGCGGSGGGCSGCCRGTRGHAPPRPPPPAHPTQGWALREKYPGIGTYLEAARKLPIWQATAYSEASMIDHWGPRVGSRL